MSGKGERPQSKSWYKSRDTADVVKHPSQEARPTTSGAQPRQGSEEMVSERWSEGGAAKCDAVVVVRAV